jgi:hypothetical protein
MVEGTDQWTVMIQNATANERNNGRVMNVQLINQPH